MGIAGIHSSREPLQARTESIGNKSLAVLSVRPSPSPFHRRPGIESPEPGLEDGIPEHVRIPGRRRILLDELFVPLDLEGAVWHLPCTARLVACKGYVPGSRFADGVIKAQNLWDVCPLVGFGEKIGEN